MDVLSRGGWDIAPGLAGFVFNSVGIFPKRGSGGLIIIGDIVDDDVGAMDCVVVVFNVAGWGGKNNGEKGVDDVNGIATVGEDNTGAVYKVTGFDALHSKLGCLNPPVSETAEILDKYLPGGHENVLIGPSPLSLAYPNGPCVESSSHVNLTEPTYNPSE